MDDSDENNNQRGQRPQRPGSTQQRIDEENAASRTARETPGYYGRGAVYSADFSRGHAHGPHPYRAQPPRPLAPPYPIGASRWVSGSHQAPPLHAHQQGFGASSFRQTGFGASSTRQTGFGASSTRQTGFNREESMQIDESFPSSSAGARHAVPGTSSGSGSSAGIRPGKRKQKRYFSPTTFQPGGFVECPDRSSDDSDDAMEPRLRKRDS